MARGHASPRDAGAHRGRERVRRVVLTGAASFGARAISFATLLVSIPITVSYLGTERFGVWATISSTAAFVGLADLGISNGLVNRIAEAHSRADELAAHRHVSNAFFSLVGISAALGVLLVVVAPFVPWDAAFNVSSPQAVREVGPAFVAFAAITIATLPLGVAQRVYTGYQEGYIPGLVLAAASLLSLALIALAIVFGASLTWLVLALSCGPFTAGLANTILLFWFRRPQLRPKLGYVDRAGAKAIVLAGFLFLAIQLAGAAAYQTDSLILAHVLGPRAVTQYTVPLRLFGIVSLLLGFGLAPLWPAYREAMVTGDHVWVRATFRRSLWLSLGVAGLSSALLVATGRWIVSVWVPSLPPAETQLLLALAVWTTLTGASGALAMFLNGLGAIRFQAMCGVTMALANVPLSIVLTQRVGIAGVLWGSVVTQVAFVLLPSAAYLRFRSPIALRLGSSQVSAEVQA